MPDTPVQGQLSLGQDGLDGDGFPTTAAAPTRPSRRSAAARTGTTSARGAICGEPCEHGGRHTLRSDPWPGHCNRPVTRPGEACWQHDTTPTSKEA